MKPGARPAGFGDGRLRDINPAIGIGNQGFQAIARGKPTAAVKVGERDAPPAQHGICNWFAGFDVHDDCRIFLDLANFAKLDIVAETGQQHRLKAGTAHIAGADSRKDKEQQATQDASSHGDAESREAERTGYAALLRCSRVPRREQRPKCSAPQFDAHVQTRLLRKA